MTTLDLILYDTDLSAHALLAYLVICRLPARKEDRLTDPWSVNDLAEICRISRAAMFRALRELDDRKLIKRIRDGRDANRYGLP